MYAGVTTTTLRRERLDEALDFMAGLGEAVVIPFGRQLPGYRGHLGLVDRATGRFTSIFLYKTEAEARQMDPGGPHWAQMMAQLTPEQTAQLQELLAAPPERSVCAVVAQE